MHSKIFVPLLSALSLSNLVSAQGGRVPVSLDTGNTVTCGGCYVVAGVAGIFFGTETLTITQTNSMVVMGNTTAFTTSVPFDSDSFTISDPSGVIAPAPTGVAAVTSFDIDGTAVTIGGQTLTGPGAVNVFTAFSTTRTTVGTDGKCSIVLGNSTSLGSDAFTVHIPASVTDASGFNSFQLVAESSFFNQFSYPSGCSGGGISVVVTGRVPVSVVPVTVTTTATNRTVAPAVISTVSVATATSTEVPTTTTTTITSSPSGDLIGSIFSSAPNVTFVTPSSGQSVITINPTAGITSTTTEIATITQAQAANANHQSTLRTLLSGALAMIVGFVA